MVTVNNELNLKSTIKKKKKPEPNLRRHNWEMKFNELKRFKKKFGHCNVSFSKRENPYSSLALWINTQRVYYRNKNKNLTAEKIAKFNSIGFSWINPIKNYTIKINDDDLLKDLKRLYKMQGRAPSSAYINKHGKYSSAAYYRHFGGISNACKAKGLKYAVYVFHAKVYTDAELLNDLVRLSLKLGRAPQAIDIEKHGKYSDETYRVRFGGICEARAKAGLEAKRTRRKVYS